MATPDHMRLESLWEQAANDGNYELASEIKAQDKALRDKEQLLRQLGDYGFDYLRSHRPHEIVSPSIDQRPQR